MKPVATENEWRHCYTQTLWSSADLEHDILARMS
jgi:hypothetical protein